MKLIVWLKQLLTPSRPKTSYPPEYAHFSLLWEERPNLFAYMLFGWHTPSQKWIYLNVTASVDEAAVWAADLKTIMPEVGNMLYHLSQVFKRTGRLAVAANE